MIIGIKADFDNFDLAELCANKLRKNIQGSKSIKIVSNHKYSEVYPANYSFSARSENWVSTPLSILNISRVNENLSTIPPRLINGIEKAPKIRLEIICNDDQLKNVDKIILSSGGENIKKQYS
ncbi:MAG: hypothetical protein ACI4WH_08310 [Oscillospiraceae bacterium]